MVAAKLQRKVTETFGEVVNLVGELGSDDFGPQKLAEPFWIVITNDRRMRFQYNTERRRVYEKVF